MFLCDPFNLFILIAAYKKNNKQLLMKRMKCRLNRSMASANVTG